MDRLLLPGGLLAVATLAVVAVWISARRSRRSRSGAPPLVFPRQGTRGGRAMPEAPVRRAAPAPPPPPAPPAEPAARPLAEARPVTEAPRGAPPTAVRSADFASPPGPATAVATEPTSDGFESPDDGTLQLLPGRVRVDSGARQGQEIRFVRVPGTPAEITFGRSQGPLHRHVQLESPTVSRLHARMRFEDGTWVLSNLSATNPTRLNGRALSGEPAEEAIRDGDRIEMGEVSFVFHQPEVRDRLPFRSSWASEIGLRSANQDAVAVRKLPGRREMAAVCDGMGSHRAGGNASHTALEALIASLAAGKDLADAFRCANQAVRNEARADPGRKGMGTTMVALLREEDRYWVGNVGDSRAYRVDAEGIRQLTRDHSFVAEAIRAGEMSRDEAARSPWRNAVTRNLGTEAEVEVDVFGEFSAEEPHVLVLCSDGLHGVLEEEDLERLVRATPEIRDVARALCDEAIRRGGKDNVTVAALAFGGGLVGPEAPSP